MSSVLLVRLVKSMTPLYVEVDYLGLFGDLSQEMEKNVKAAQAR